MNALTTLILVLLTTDPTTGAMTIGVRPMSAATCAERLAEIRAAAPANLAAFCAEPGQMFQLAPYKGS